MDASHASIIASTFFWLGLVVAISFLEAPLKFRAPNVTVQIGLGIGRLVFRALNAVEAALAVVLVIALAMAQDAATSLALGLAIVVLAVQLVAVRPALTRRSDAVLAGEDGPRSHAHLVYIALEVVKVVSLIVGGVAALGATG